MDEILEGIAPTLVTVLAAIISALGTYAVTWLRGRAKQLGAAREAALEVELASLTVPMTGAVKKQKAMRLASAKLAPKLSLQIEQALPDARKEAETMRPPPDPTMFVGSDTPTDAEMPSAKKLS